MIVFAGVATGVFRFLGLSMGFKGSYDLCKFSTGFLGFILRFLGWPMFGPLRLRSARCWSPVLKATGCNKSKKKRDKFEQKTGKKQPQTIQPPQILKTKHTPKHKKSKKKPKGNNHIFYP